MKIIRNQFGIGPKVSLFTLGTMRAIESKAQMYSVLKRACLIGINHIETAPIYGPAETFLGESLEKLNFEGIHPQGGWIITTKIIPNCPLAKGKKQIKGMLKRLGVEKIHNLAIHGLNLSTHLNWALNGDGYELFEWARDENLIEQVGFSSHGSYSLIQSAIESNHFNFCSLHLHLLDPERIPLAQKALEKGMGVMAISPADKGGHLHTPSQTLIDDCYPIAPIEIAYRFLLSQGVSTLTIGAQSCKDLDLTSKLINANDPLRPLEKVVISRIHSNAKRRLGNTFCGQCRECLPCPMNVPIPEILRLRNLAIGHELQSFSKERYNLIGKAGHWWETHNASSCQKCGDCLPRCPNNLLIPDLLEETHSELLDSPKRRLWE
ncbi:aldo/keto reductase [Prochlorococcus marinus]|uniref:aldo/keto reductase n=1 Tax=Prochlorococcus marinus TaxID=1219 RepID=UPI0022B30E2E|nr:aldo/keto reductase [Prochlorococcus marinus]